MLSTKNIRNPPPSTVNTSPCIAAVVYPAAIISLLIHKIDICLPSQKRIYTVVRKK